MRGAIRVFLFVLHLVHLHQLFHIQAAVSKIYFIFYIFCAMDEVNIPTNNNKPLLNARFSFSNRKLLLRPKATRQESRDGSSQVQ